MSRPICLICGEPIYDDMAYIMNEFDEFGSCICIECMNREMNVINKSSINDSLAEYLKEYLYDRKLYRPGA